ncbi:MAG TPA: hypothetical protein DCL35_02410 [Candidatus Omnitrophica bacterium]|nr:hypothetical protein [Candidatus Omnitrophota bacterium]
MNCPLCQNTSTTKLFEAPNVHGRFLWDASEYFDIRRCLSCGAVYIDNLSINDDYYRKYYPACYYDEGKISEFLGFVLGLVTHISLKSKERTILRYLKDGPGKSFKILDIGCGRGDFLESLKKNKFEKFGLEINDQGYQECLKKDIKISKEGVASSGFKDEFFDAITLWHVLEHLPDPLKTLNELKRVLKKDGILVIGTPNTDSLGFKLGKNLWFHLDAPRHLTLFGKRSIEFLAQSTGFELMWNGTTFFDYPLDLFWSLRKSRFRFIVYPFYPIMKWISRETILAICRKK